MTHPDCFRIAILGNFSGAPQLNDSTSGRSSIRPWQIDRDNFTDVMRKLKVHLHDLQFLPGTPTESITFASIDDFHPDQLFERLEIFTTFRTLREQLQTPEFANQALAEVSGWMNKPSATSSASKITADATDIPNVVESNLAPAAGDSLLDNILDSHAEQGSAQQPAGAGDPWSEYIASIAAPYAHSPTDPQISDALQWLDQSIQAIMQRILAIPQLQKLESSWRALHRLVHRLETGPELKLFLFDVDRDALASDLSARSENELLALAESSEGSKLWKTLVTDAVETEGGDEWSLIVGDYYFGTVDEDIQLLDKMAALASASGAPFVAGAALSRFADVANPNWQKLRHSTAAEYVSLAWPRFLSRLPYGPHTKPIETFDFDETANTVPPKPQWWGNSAFLVAQLLGQAFTQHGWQMTPGDVSQIQDLPLWIREIDGETDIHPCGEKLLSDSAAEQLLTLGITPIVSVRNQDRISVPWFNSLSGKQLAGRWKN